MAIKIFNNKKIKISKISSKDLAEAKQFRDFINSLVKEDVQIRVNKKQTLGQEKEWLAKKIKQVQRKTALVLVARHNNKIIANAGINLGKGRRDHIGSFWIAVRRGYRGAGLGSYLSQEAIKLAEKGLKTRPRLIKLSVYPTNWRAIRFYQKQGFKKASMIPKQVQYKGKLISEIIMLKTCE